MSKHDDFDDNIGDEVEQFLNSVHGKEEEKEKDKPKSKLTPKGNGKIDVTEEDLSSSPEYEEVKVALEEVFKMCEKHGFSIQVALSDEPFNNDGERGNRITICGHMTPHNVPCEMIAAAAVYQAHHLFSHMVLAMASAGSPLINPVDEDDEDEDE